MPTANCFMLLVHLICCALLFARERAGSSIAAKMAMMAMTTRSSMRVKPVMRLEFRKAYCPVILVFSIVQPLFNFVFYVWNVKLLPGNQTNEPGHSGNECPGLVIKG